MTANRCVVALALVLATGGCSALSDFDGYEFGSSVDSGTDAGTVDSGTDAGGPEDGGTTDGGGTDAGPTPSRPVGIVQSSGGATIVTSEYRLTITVGAPQPMGRRTGASEDLLLGPEAL